MASSGGERAVTLPSDFAITPSSVAEFAFLTLELAMSGPERIDQRRAALIASG